MEKPYGLNSGASHTVCLQDSSSEKSVLFKMGPQLTITFSVMFGNEVIWAGSKYRHRKQSGPSGNLLDMEGNTPGVTHMSGWYEEYKRV